MFSIVLESSILLGIYCTTLLGRMGSFRKPAAVSISLVSPSSAGAFLGLNFFMTDAISSRDKDLSPSVSAGWLLYLLSDLPVNCAVTYRIVFGNKTV